MLVCSLFKNCCCSFVCFIFGAHSLRCNAVWVRWKLKFSVCLESTVRSIAKVRSVFLWAFDRFSFLHAFSIYILVGSSLSFFSLFFCYTHISHNFRSRTIFLTLRSFSLCSLGWLLFSLCVYASLLFRQVWKVFRLIHIRIHTCTCNGEKIDQVTEQIANVETWQKINRSNEKYFGFFRCVCEGGGGSLRLYFGYIDEEATEKYTWDSHRRKSNARKFPLVVCCTMKLHT